jgi:hypothetical protein
MFDPHIHVGIHRVTILVLSNISTDFSAAQCILIDNMDGCVWLYIEGTRRGNDTLNVSDGVRYGSVVGVF